MCVHARQGRENFGCFLVLLQYCIIYIYIYIVVVWTAVCLTGYSDYLTGFHEPLSTSYICRTGLKTVYHNHWQSFGLFVIMMQWSLLCTLHDCHDNINVQRAFLEGQSVHQDFYDDDFFIVFFLCSLYVPFRDFSCAFCPATVVSVAVCLVVLSGSFLFRKVLYFSSF